MEDRKLHKHVTQRLSALKNIRSEYISDWMELSDFVLGARGQFLTDEKVKGRGRNPQLYNETAKQAAQTLAAGMMAGITSPARPWFRLGTPDPAMMEFGPVKMWLDEVQRIMLTIFSRSNFYNVMQNMYLELGVFGVACSGLYENFDKVIRCEDYTVGSYCIGLDGERNSDALYREYSMTVGAMMKRFGEKGVSKATKNLWDRGQVDQKVKVIHAIERNDGRKFDSPLAKDMPWRSVYFEEGCDGDKPALISGFESKPFIAPRWSTVGDEVYSSAYPGLDSLGTNRSLQIEELDLAIAREKMHNPPLIGDSSLAQAGADLIAGGITYVPNMTTGGKPGLAPVYDVNPRVLELNESIAKKEARIERFFFADLFLMITQMDRAQITATEIAERKEEKMMMLGPVLESLNYEALDPIIDRTFAIAQKAGILPPAPKELEGVDLRVEYMSVLHQAQKAVSTTSIESSTAFAANLAQVWPEARHKINAGQAVDEYVRAKGASPKILNDDDYVAQQLQTERQAAMQQQMMEQGAVAAQSAKSLSEAKTDEGSVLDALTGRA